MATGINLTNSFQEKKENRKKERILTGGMAIAFIILLLTFGALLGVKWYANGLAVRLTALKNQIMEESKQFSDPKAMRLVDFYERMRIMEAASQYTSQEPVRILQEFERSMVSGVTLTSYHQTNDQTGGAVTVVVEAAADNLDTMAKQILRVKQSPLFSNIIVGESVRTTEGKISFTMTVSVDAAADAEGVN